MQHINADFIIPFIESTRSAFDVMLHMKLKQKEIYIKKNYVMFGDVSGSVGISTADRVRYCEMAGLVGRMGQRA